MIVNLINSLFLHYDKTIKIDILRERIVFGRGSR
jgi:hypothetical protein